MADKPAEDEYIELIKLRDWLTKRIDERRNYFTTLTMLKRKIKKLNIFSKSDFELYI